MRHGGWTSDEREFGAWSARLRVDFVARETSFLRTLSVLRTIDTKTILCCSHHDNTSCFWSTILVAHELCSSREGSSHFLEELAPKIARRSGARVVLHSNRYAFHSIGMPRCIRPRGRRSHERGSIPKDGSGGLSPRT
jgi:hypothetical protein